MAALAGIPARTRGQVQTLILSPHVDDEVLGAFSFLCASTHVLYFGCEERPTIPVLQRLRELETVARCCGFAWELLDHHVNRYDVRDLIAPIEHAVARLRPELVVIPLPSYNQDHRAVHDAAITALRPHDRNHFVPRVLGFEQPQSLLWPTRLTEVQLFRAIDIEAKLDAYRLYASQVRGHRSPELLRAMAALRGHEAGTAFAEGFVVKRWIYTE